MGETRQRCAHPCCPGYPYRASDRPHPPSTCTDEGRRIAGVPLVPDVLCVDGHRIAVERQLAPRGVQLHVNASTSTIVMSPGDVRRLISLLRSAIGEGEEHG